ncbi:MAG: hypothetical protein JKY45_01660 [Emcibacter sp.]|nr:hypothetical protein [Emcibacter sp.]
MVDHISHATMAYGIGTAYGQSSIKTDQTSSNQPVPTTPGQRVVTDRIDLSPQARQTLEQRDQMRKDEQDKLTKDILEKGLHTWAQEKYREKIETEARAQVLSSMGLDEDSYANLEAETQQRIQKIIEDKIREKMREEMVENIKETGNGLEINLLSL